MTDLTVSTTTDFTLTGVSDVTSLTYTNILRTSATVTLNASQLHFNAFTSTWYLYLTGSSAINSLVVLVDVTQAVYGYSFALTNWSASDRITFQGDGQDNYIFGTLAADTLMGGAGHDYLDGGAGGYDKILGEEGDDQIRLRLGQVEGGAGNDILQVDFSDAAAFALNIADGGGGRTVAGLRITGVEGLNLVGSGGDDTVVGGLLADAIRGGAGNDRITSAAGGDVVQGEEGQDTILGGEGADRLEGGAGLDALQGGAGGDRLIGGAGADLLTGNLGADRFIFQVATDSSLATGVDRITDFKPNSDKIDLIALEFGPGGFKPLYYIGETEFNPNSSFYSEVRWYQDATMTHIEVTGPYGSMQIDLQGLVTLTREDFIL